MLSKVKKILSHIFNFGSKRSVKKIKYIVIHYTANDGDTDENNGKYFKNNRVGASAHYFVDSDSATQSVPDNYIAWSVGGSKYSNCHITGGGKFHGKCTNTNSLSIEICDDNRNGKIYPSQATIKNTITLTKELMKKYNIPAKNVIRHFDVTGKACPAYWTDDKKWKAEFWNKLTEEKKETTTTKKPATVSGPLYQVRKSVDDAASSKGSFKNLENAIKQCEKYKEQGYEVYNSITKKVVYKPIVKNTTTKKKTNEQIAEEIWRGKCSDSRWSTWGNGQTRINRLKAAGYNPDAIQKIIDKKYS